ncbi:MAG: glycosyltransferase [Candidatus Bathyarchaeota archaeon]|nr:glycosyltransferase [Candidatus Bathyarchaeota archaeon]
MFSKRLLPNGLVDKKMSHPLVSVIIPTKNRPSYATLAVQSALNQTFNDLEIILVDGSSNRIFGEMVGKLEDKRIRYYLQEGGRGVSAARNFGIGRAKGRFLAFLDDDDVWLPHHVEKQVSVLKNDGVRCVYSSSCYLVNEDGVILGSKFFEPNNNNNDMYHKLLKSNVTGNCSGFMASKDCFTEVGFFDEQLFASEDWDMWIRLAKKNNFVSVDGPTYMYRLHRKRLSNDYTPIIKAQQLLFRKVLTDIASAPNKNEALRCWRVLLGTDYLQYGANSRARHEYSQAIQLDKRSISLYLRYLSACFPAQVYNWGHSKLEPVIIQIKNGERKGLLYNFL